jgi:hypothetical protein
MRWRFGVGVARERGYISQYDVSSLCLGWYHDWNFMYNAPRPEGMEYMQLIRVSPEHFDLAHPSSYNWTSLDAVICNNRGAVWMIGNEPDGRAPGACDMRSPNEYARIFKIFRDHIKAVDSTAQISNGPIIEPTPLRMDWLTKVWDEYVHLYGTGMPVDVWNIHDQIVKEAPQQGADIPIGCDPALGVNYDIQQNDSLPLFIEHVTRMRQWMKSHGQQNKQLVISEYGVLQPEYEGFTRDRVNDFMTATFTYMLNAKDTNLGMPEDGYRLVQRWAWFSLNTPLGTGGQGGAWNGNLFDPATRQITANGRNYGRIACSAVHPTPTPNTTRRSPFTHREAEDGSTHGAAYRAQINSASDCLYVTGAGDVTFNVYIPDTGDYYVWGRVWGTNYDNKVFTVQVSHYNEVYWYIEPGGWTWDRVSAYPQTEPMVFHLEGGRWHSIRIGPRGGGGQARVDWIEVTSDRAYTPGSASNKVCNPTATPSPTKTRTPTRTATPTITRTPMPLGPGRISGRVAYQGRGTDPDPSWVGTLIVSAHLPGDPIPAYAFNASSDENGYFEVPSGVLPGRYDVGVRDTHSLRNLRQDVQVTDHTADLSMGTLIEGDANLDNRVDIFDFAILAGAFGKERGQTGFDIRADFNNDLTIDIFDFALLADNYGSLGDASSAPAAAAAREGAGPASLGSVTVYVQPSPKTVSVNQVFTVDVYAAAGTSQVYGLDSWMKFDTTYLEVQAITPGTALGSVLAAGISGDTITYRAGVSLGAPPVTGTFKLFTLRIRAKQPTASTLLRWDVVNIAGPGGEHHTAVKNNGTIVILAASPTPTASNTPTMKRVFGKVTDVGGQPLAGAVIRLYRMGTLHDTKTTSSAGTFAFFISPVMTGYRLTEEDPAGYASITATLPSGISGSVVDANTIDFTLPSGSEVGQFTFIDARSSATVTPTPTEGTPTATPTELVTATPTNTPSTGTIQGHVYEDRNSNEQFDAGEGIAEATVKLSGMLSGLVDTRQTDQAGLYTFASVEAGSYRLEVTQLPSDYELVDPSPWAISLDPGETLTVDFVVRRKATPGVYLPFLKNDVPPQ